METAALPASTEAIDGNSPPINTEKHLITKLVEVMSEVDHVEKRGRNTFQNYNYVRAADVAHAVRQGLASRGILMYVQKVVPRHYEIAAKNDGVMQAIDLHMTYVFTDGVDSLAVECMGTGTDKGDKAVYKALTGALKYVLRTTFLIPDDTDPEVEEKADATAGKETKRAQPAAATKKPEPAANNDAPATSAAPEPSAAAKSESYYDRVGVLKQTLLKAGFKAEGTKTAASVLLQYILQTANVGKLEDMSGPRWETVLSTLEALAPPQLLETFSSYQKSLTPSATA